MRGVLSCKQNKLYFISQNFVFLFIVQIWIFFFKIVVYWKFREWKEFYCSTFSCFLNKQRLIFSGVLLHVFRITKARLDSLCLWQIQNIPAPNEHSDWKMFLQLFCFNQYFTTATGCIIGFNSLFEIWFYVFLDKIGCNEKTTAFCSYIQTTTHFFQFPNVWLFCGHKWAQTSPNN